MNNISRKEFIKYSSVIIGASLIPQTLFSKLKFIKKSGMKLGLVTYLWGKDWDVPTIIKNCTKAGIKGVELRVEHAHGVTINLNPSERAKIRSLFTESNVKFLGMGTNQRFDYPDKEELKNSINIAKEFIKLSYDIGGSGIKVKPNGFHKGIPKKKTITQIGKSLNELAKFGEYYGQEIRLEVHGKGTQLLPNIKAIMKVADHQNAVVCWNSNSEDLVNGGLEYNFNLVKNKLGDTVHIRELNIGDYPYKDLMDLLIKKNYKGWILLECRTNPEDKIKALIEQREIWEQMVS